MKKPILLTIVALALGLAATAQAQSTIFANNFDTATGTLGGYGFGDNTNSTRTYTDGIGVSGTRAVLIQSDYIGTAGFGGYAYQFQNGTTTGNTSANVNDYTLAFDAKVNVANGGFSLIAQTWTGTGFGGTQTGQRNTTSDIRLTPANAFQHFAINIGTLTNSSAGTFLPTGGTWQIAWQMNLGNYGSEPLTGAQLVIDNVSLTMVPEPSTFALAALGAVGGFVFLRRRRA